MPATATVVGATWGFVLQLYINGLRKNPLLRSEWPPALLPDSSASLSLIVHKFFLSATSPRRCLVVQTEGRRRVDFIAWR